ncbi:uncharacterized protein DUF922 [Christiangramia gaetbulicola]|uniref:Uncharacterized protein DUF922 n=1 Tax=Christiangramia gaetbulicola TaxID=703340 RepID=A0A2T6AF35_9FLAO|nr:DUF922 domain-containing protein [Christiangramia gaetbulicola]PTX42421.1 uncharacterized protein DUF922 [Christiangramia gaetbulicola]
MKIHGLLICCLLCIASSLSQEEQEKIKWQEGRPLTWEDFKAEPDTTLSYSANTNSGISYTWNYSTATGVPVLEHEVFTNFYPNKSWVQKDIHDEDYLLKHEQLHFDISELHARKLRKALAEYEILRNIRQDLKRIYNRIEAERVEMQNKFDRETSHSENKEAERKWREFVKQELKKLAKYSS